MDRLTLQAQGTASGAGTVTLAFAPVPGNLVLTGIASVPRGATAAASWLAYLGRNGPLVGGWFGSTSYGPLQLVGNEELILVGSALTPGASVLAVFTGRSDAARLAPAPPYPLPLVSTMLIFT